MKQTKHNNKWVEFQGIKFQSQLECNYYKYLLTIPDIKIELQPKFILIPKYKYMDENRRETLYVADFKITYPNGSFLIVDTKGQATETSKLKRKLFEYMFPDINLLWTAESKKYGLDGWINYDQLKKLRAKAKKEKKQQ